MVRNKRKSKKGIGIVLLLIFLILASIGIIIYLFITNNKNELALNKNKKELLAIKENYNLILESNTDLSNELTKINNIKEEIQKEKEELFKLASNLEKKIQNKETKYKIAYLTFDDGPYYSTNKYLDVLKKYKVKATFFTIGLDKDICYDNQSKDCSGMYKKIVDNGHTIANHTYSHLIFKGLYGSANSFITQVQKQENLIKKRTGVWFGMEVNEGNY